MRRKVRVQWHNLRNAQEDAFAAQELWNTHCGDGWREAVCAGEQLNGHQHEVTACLKTDLSGSTFLVRIGRVNGYASSGQKWLRREWETAPPGGSWRRSSVSYSWTALSATGFLLGFLGWPSSIVTLCFFKSGSLRRALKPGAGSVRTIHRAHFQAERYNGITQCLVALILKK